jgi:ABC-type cobalamin/Fe3+-siderophores transport system ATPase subunit
MSPAGKTVRPATREQAAKAIAIVVRDNPPDVAVTILSMVALDMADVAAGWEGKAKKAEQYARRLFKEVEALQKQLAVIKGALLESRQKGA